MTDAWELTRGNSPIVAVAVHDGHWIRPELLGKVALGERDRLREEDPFTARWLGLSDTRIRVRRSRFEVDLNRPRAGAVYRTPSDAWGLSVWREALTPAELRASLAIYDAFYAALGELLTDVCQRHGGFVVYDLHSYNHRRGGPGGPAALQELTPEINVGTGSLDRSRWGHVAEGFIDRLRRYPFRGRHLDVRENVNFRGGELSRWVHRNFGESGCALAIEVKKFFMDEWTGEVDEALLAEVGAALASTTTHVLHLLSPRRGRVAAARTGSA
jgi:N-formylglutamate amidohydrolase